MQKRNKKAKVHQNVRTRARMVQQMVAEHYEPGRQDRCKSWVYRHVVNKRLPMSERTFWRYLHMNLDTSAPLGDQSEDKRQLKLFE